MKTHHIIKNIFYLITFTPLLSYASERRPSCCTTLRTWTIHAITTTINTLQAYEKDYTSRHFPNLIRHKHLPRRTQTSIVPRQKNLLYDQHQKFAHQQEFR